MVPPLACGACPSTGGLYFADPLHPPSRVGQNQYPDLGGVDTPFMRGARSFRALEILGYLGHPFHTWVMFLAFPHKLGKRTTPPSRVGHVSNEGPPPA